MSISLWNQKGVFGLLERYRALVDLINGANDVMHAAAVLGWDQETYMPEGGNEARTQQMATLERIAHERFTSDEIGRLLEELAPWEKAQPYDSDEASMIRVTRRLFERTTRIPPALIQKMAEARGRGFNTWVKARRESNYELFRPRLEELVELATRQADALGYDEQRYDALIDSYEPGMKTSEVREVLTRLKGEMVPLVRQITDRTAEVDDAFLYREYEDARQWDFTMEILKTIGFDLSRGRQDRAEHPFTTSFSPGDVRVTTRIKPRDLASGLFATIHEGGHGLYDQGLPVAYARTPLCNGASSGVHESQSLMWENIVGRSREFWTYFFPRLAERFPEELAGISADRFYQAANKAKASLIRVDADEVTYNLHIYLRFELELEMFNGRIDFRRLPEAWNDRMRDYLGIVPDNDANGVLQDVHWSEGLFGYFPSYTLGHIMAVQFYREALKAHPDIPAQIAAGRFDTLRSWLNSNIHARGAKYTPGELIGRVTGGPLDVQPYLQYIRQKYLG